MKYMTFSELEKLLNDLIEKTSFSIDEANLIFDEDKNELWYKIQTNDSKFFIGRNGENLMALSHLIKRIIEKYIPEESPIREVSKNIIVDVNSYQRNKIERIRTIAHMMAERARYFKSNIEVDPMSSYERRIVHEHLSDSPDVETESTGTGRDRRVVIKYSSEKQTI